MLFSIIFYSLMVAVPTWLQLFSCQSNIHTTNNILQDLVCSYRQGRHAELMQLR